MEFFAVIAVCAAIGLIPATIAHSKDHRTATFLTWWFLGAVFFIVALPASILMDPRTRCPYCAEKIQREAIVCRYCGHDL